MQFIRPNIIRNLQLVSSTVPEPDVGEIAWSPTEINALGEERYIGSPTSVVTISNGSPGVVTWAGNALAEETPVVFTTTDTLPTGLSPDTIYFIKARLTDDTFSVSATEGGAAIRTSSAGAGVHTATAHVHQVYEAQAGSKATCTISNAAPAVVTQAAHGHVADTPIVFTTTGGLPTGLVVGTTYYVKSPATDTYQVSATAGGAAINTSSAGTGVHTAGLEANYNKPPMLNDTVWLPARATNRWAMFDAEIGSYTEAAESFTVVLQPGRFDSISALAVDGALLEFSMVVDSEVVYEKSIDLQNGVEVGDWWSYYYEPIYEQDTVALTEIMDAALLDLPAFGDGELTITLSRPGGTVRCGVMVLGMCATLGETKKRPVVRIVDYSTKERDRFGRLTIERGDFSKEVSYAVRVADEDVDYVARILSTYRSTALVFIASGNAYACLVVYGFYTDWDMPIDPPKNTVLSIKVEGLTES